VKEEALGGVASEEHAACQKDPGCYVRKRRPGSFVHLLKCDSREASA